MSDRKEVNEADLDWLRERDQPLNDMVEAQGKPDSEAKPTDNPYWCCTGDFGGEHDKNCRYHHSNYAPQNPPPEAVKRVQPEPAKCPKCGSPLRMDGNPPTPTGCSNEACQNEDLDSARKAAAMIMAIVPLNKDQFQNIAGIVSAAIIWSRLEAVERVQPEPAKLKMGFLIRIEGHSDVVGNMFSPESLKMLLGELLEKQSGQMIQEGVDFDLEVNRTYEQR